MRVISGSLKGRIIKGYQMKGTRPTMDRVKESLFAMIQGSIKDAICLDLFAGSGSLGIEALSNGASFCYFIDNNKEAYQTIITNLETFNIVDKAKVFKEDYKISLNYFKDKNIKFNLIFLDPPYKNNCLPDILYFISNNDLLYPDGQVICEFSGYNLDLEYQYLKLIKQRQYGDKTINIYKYNK